MPDPAHSNLPIAVQVTNMILTWLQGVIVLYLAFLGNRNADKIDNVQTTQQKAAETTQVVKDTLDTKAADEIEQNRSKLYGNWKALDWIAETPDEKKKAGEAKRLYDEYLKKYPPK